MKKRYKIRKEQLERVVESFVMESASNKRITLTEEEALIAESKKSFMAELDGKISQFVKGGYITKPTEEEMKDFLAKAEADGYGGRVGHTGVEWGMANIKRGGRVQKRKVPKAPGKLAYIPIGGSRVDPHGAGSGAGW